VTRLPRSLKGAQVVRALVRAGYEAKEGRRHTIIHDGVQIVTTVPRGRKPIKPGTLRGILRDAGLTVDEFLDLL